MADCEWWSALGTHKCDSHMKTRAVHTRWRSRPVAMHIPVMHTKTPQLLPSIWNGCLILRTMNAVEAVWFSVTKLFQVVAIRSAFACQLWASFIVLTYEIVFVRKAIQYRTKWDGSFLHTKMWRSVDHFAHRIGFGFRPAAISHESLSVRTTISSDA